MRFLPFFLLMFFALSFTRHENDIRRTTENCFFKLGEKLLSVAKHGDERKVPFMLISLHSNETTAIEAAKIFIEKEGGLFLELLNYNQRLIEFHEGDEKFVFDPNRIFTPAGRIANLKLNNSYHEIAERQVQQFARFVLAQIPKNKTIVAVHNNTEGKYTINEYIKGNKLERDAQQVFQNPALDEDDFFLTTDLVLFKSLKLKNFNVILQNENTA
ncbi:MAG: hypothetical protein ABR503_04855, partial [Chitinophagaceae bacterium]